MLKPLHVIRICVVAIASTFALAGPLAADPAKDAAAARADIKRTLGFVPQFLNVLPDPVLSPIWDEMKALQLSSTTALTPKQKELIGLGVAAQVPCEYCTYAHTEFAKLHGASQAEIAEAVASAALVRHWSAFVNGTMPDEAKFRADLVKGVDNLRKVTSGKGPALRPIAIVDAKSAHEDIQQHFGAWGDVFKRFPPEAIAAAWRGIKEFDMAKTALDPKTKALVAVAVGAQIPCRYCVIVDTEFAKLAGATEREINEALAMSALIRSLSTMVNGLQVDPARFRQDIARIVKGAREAPTRSARRPEGTGARTPER